MRKELSALETLEVTERIQHAWLVGMSNTMAGDLPVFQGGTCLHLAYGSPRFSQDMDFMVTSVEGLNDRVTRAAEIARQVLEEANPGCLEGWEWRVTMRGGGETDLRNPRMYHLTVQAKTWVRSIKVKAEFFLVSDEQMARCATELVATRDMEEPKTLAARSLQPEFSAMIRALSIKDLVADKIFAAAGREFSKARDWFDLWWIHRHVSEATLESMIDWSKAGWSTRCNMYQPGDTDANWAMRGLLVERNKRLKFSGRERMVHVEEIGQWLLAHPELQRHARDIVDNSVALVNAISKALYAEVPERSVDVEMMNAISEVAAA